jgi:peroxiredoxin
MNLQDRLDALKADFESGKFPLKPSPAALETMRRATAELIASGRAERALKAGDRAPEFTLNDPDGNPISSRKLLAQGPVVFSFYRGVWCPYCNLELQALQAALPEIKARGANLLALSPQTAANSRKSQRQNELSFPILSDVKSEVARAFGIRFALPEYLVDLYKSFKNDLPAFNDDPSWVLPMPARYVIATDGTIAYAEVNPDYTHRPDPSELLPVLDRLRLGAGQPPCQTEHTGRQPPANDPVLTVY